MNFTNSDKQHSGERESDSEVEGGNPGCEGDAGRTDKRAGGAWHGWRTQQKKANVKAGVQNTKSKRFFRKSFSELAG